MQACYNGNRSTYNAGLDIFWIDMDTRISNFSIGDLVNCVGVPGSGFYSFSAPKVAIEDISGTQMKVKAFEITYATSGMTETKLATMNVINRLSRSYWAGIVNMEREFSARAPGNRFASVKSLITYHATKPGLVEKFTPITGTGAEVNTINAATTPTISTWKSWIASGREYVVQDSEIVNIDTLYKRTVKYSNCR